MSPRHRLAPLAMPILLALAGCADTDGLRRMTVLDCGRLLAHDQSRWTPGVNEGQSREMSNNCYLIEHARGTLLWETGVPDSVAAHPEGLLAPSGVITWFRDRTLAAQLQELGITPDAITHLAFSHTHGDHVGNVAMLPAARLLIQRPEHEFVQRTSPGLIDPRQALELLDGDHDVFGDGSVMILSTPGHTPGHQSLLVRLPRTGPVLLSGDLVHFQYMWEHRIVPSFNVDVERSRASIDRVARLLAEHGAQLWIGHDAEFTARIDRAPRYHE